MSETSHRVAGGFTLLEMMVVVAITGLLVGILLPSLGAAHEAAKAIKCASNLRQLGQANFEYAAGNDGIFAPAHNKFLRNLDRWHGSREALDQPFDPAKGPLTPYLGADGEVKCCPNFTAPLGGAGAFEAGCGGYGYNAAYIGSGIGTGAQGINAFDEPADVAKIINPQRKIMFADAAFLALKAPGQVALIEYSFIEPPSSGLRPSMHFRHPGRTANVCWADGHVSPVPFGHTLPAPAVWDENNIGWIGKDAADALKHFVRE